jgi:hypothetical protein
MLLFTWLFFVRFVFVWYLMSFYMLVKVKYICVLIVILLTIATFNVNAISLTSNRIYLDNNNRVASFIVLNRSLTAEECRLSFRYFEFDNAAVMGKELTDTLPSNNTSKTVKFSPRRFSIAAGKSQAIRLSLRRSADTDKAEYHSYLSVSCGKISPPTPNLVNVAPRLVHNVPIVARTAKLNAQASFTNVKLLDNGKVSFRLNREGNRSIYGDLEVLNKRTGKKVNGLKSISIYTQSSYRDFEFSVPVNLAESDISLRFTEVEKYGGSLTVTHND